MDSELCIGIAAKAGWLVVAALEPGHPVSEAEFPATELGVKAIEIFLADCREPVRLAVTGASLSLALALGNEPGRQTFIVSSAVADQPIELAHYAEHVL